MLHDLQGWLVPPRVAPELACLAAVASGRNGGRGTAARCADQIAELAQTICAETRALYRDLAKHQLLV